MSYEQLKRILHYYHGVRTIFYQTLPYNMDVEAAEPGSHPSIACAYAFRHAGRLFRMTSLQLSSEVRASTPAPPPKSATQGKKQPASKAKAKGAKKRKRRHSSSDDDDDDYSGSDGDFRADLDGRGSTRQSPVPAAQAGPSQQVAGRSSASGGGKARRRRLSAAATAAAAHTWQQPDSLAALLFDVTALRAALVKGEGAARQPRTLRRDIACMAWLSDQVAVWGV